MDWERLIVVAEVELMGYWNEWIEDDGVRKSLDAFGLELSQLVGKQYKTQG